VSSRLSLLLIAPAMPASGGNGLAMRLGIFLEGLARVADIDLVILPISGPANDISPLCVGLGIRPNVIPANRSDDTQFRLIMGLADAGARRKAFAAYDRPSLAAFLTVPAIAALRRHIAGRHYDGMHIARSYLLPLLDLWPGRDRPFVSVDLDEDDVTTLRGISGLYRARGEEERALWDELEAAAFDRLLRRWLPLVSMAFISSVNDKEKIESRQPEIKIEVIPNGVSIPSGIHSVRTNASNSNLLFVGGFGYLPNLDAALWLTQTIWPRLIERISVSLTLVGNSAPASLQGAANGEGIELVGAAADLQPFYARATLALVPIRAGGGTRLKLLEAAAHRVPVVSTTAGAEGLELRDEQHLWIGDGDAGFAQACLEALSRPDERRRRTQAAAEIVESLYNRERITADLGDRIAAALNQGVRNA
jgi:glycosyltransferase involved in cell wall biosynthesis